MHFVVVDTHRFVKISRHLYYYRRCLIYTHIFRCYCYPFSFLSRIVLCLFLSNIVKLVFNSIKTVKKKPLLELSKQITYHDSLSN